MSTARYCIAIVAASLLALVAGCATPAQVADSIAREHGFTRTVLHGDPFDHLAYARLGAGDTLHVYLENDGVPWLNRNVVALDPTPRRAVMLELMTLDAAPVLYLGRPCYFGQTHPPSCGPAVWTSERYSPAVVDSLASALRAYLRRVPFATVALFGHSGGGALAVLLAQHVPETVAVVTLAGNLDLAGWTAYHGYSPLKGSIDPALQGPLNPRILQWHYTGGRDNNVPARLIQAYARSRSGVRTSEMSDFDHACCWSRAWPQILTNLTTNP